MRAPRATTIARLPDREADEVALARTGGAPWLAWSTATLERERTLLARREGERWSEPEEVAPGCARAFRPVIAALADGVLVAACAKADGRYRASLLWRRGGGAVRRFTLGGERGHVFHAALAATADDDRAWLAFEEREGARWEIVVGRVDAGGGFARAALPAATAGRRWPALAADARGAWLAWVEDARVAVARVEDGRVGSPVRVDEDPATADAPAVAVGPGGRLLVAWHTAAPDPRDRVGRWLRAATLDGDAFRVEAPEPALPAAREDAPEDQMWELPAIAVASDGAAWLAGRSSHGWHVARRAHDGAWSPRARVSPGGWGGRGRRAALLADGAAALLARRDPDGIVLTRLEEDP